MANELKLPKVNKNIVLIGLLSLCLLVIALLGTGLLGGTTETDAGTEPLSTEGSNPGEDQGLALVDSSNAQNQSNENNLTETSSEGAILQEELVNNSEESLSYTPSELKKLRDPFQSLLRKPQSLVTSSAQQGHSDQSQQVQRVDVSSAKPKAVPKQANSAANKSNTAQKKTETESTLAQRDVHIPPFALNGVVSQGGIQKAILVSKGNSYIVGKGERVLEWVIEGITQTGVRVKDESGQRFMITFEGVTMDESKK